MKNIIARNITARCCTLLDGELWSVDFCTVAVSLNSTEMYAYLPFPLGVQKSRHVTRARSTMTRTITNSDDRTILRKFNPTIGEGIIDSMPLTLASGESQARSSHIERDRHRLFHPTALL